MSNCYLCAKPASNPLELSNTFTMHSSAKCPDSKLLCDRCYSTISGNQKQLWYWNEGKNKWSKLWGRSLSRVYQGDTLIAPIIKGTHTEGKDTFSVVRNLLTRVEIREYLLNPPEPPFTIAIAESGQKHIIPWALEARSCNFFPIQFELDTVYIDNRFKESLQVYEQLMGLGFSKSEIDSGNYRSDRLMKVFDKFWELEESIKAIRGTRLMELINYVAQLQSSAVVAEIKPIPVIPVSPTSPDKSNPVQLSLF
jgi:hypothetical protein